MIDIIQGVIDIAGNTTPYVLLLAVLAGIIHYQQKKWKIKEKKIYILEKMVNRYDNIVAILDSYVQRGETIPETIRLIYKTEYEKARQIKSRYNSLFN